jgi:predicted 2-oxoglutarate/Fe(II)-dependent dioxygenase YbiX
MERRELDTGVYTIDDVLSPAECEQIIRRAENIGFEAAALNTVDGPRVDPGVRNNDRVILDDAALARELWSRVAQHVPPVWAGRQARGLNERFRFYRYTPGQRFTWHVDGAYERENGEKSFFTLLINLNEGYGAGATKFHHLAVDGRAGMALVFDHVLPHEGAELSAGVKYVLRSDVMYGRVGQFRA